MKSKIPDNVVYSVEEGFNANILPYATKCAPVIRWWCCFLESRGIDNKQGAWNKFNELRIQYQVDGRIRVEWISV
jgi:hypothetical protein